MSPTRKEEKRRRQEAEFFNLARSLFDDVPKGEFEQPEPPAPDILVRTDRDILGVEITQLFQTAQGGLIEGQQQDIVGAAQARWSRGVGPSVLMNVGFAQGLPPRKRDAVRALLDLVQKHMPEQGGSRALLPGSVAGVRDLPAWLNGLVIFRTELDVGRRWVGGSVWSTQALTRERLEASVSSKESKVEAYRGCCDRVWLLVVCDLWPMGASFSIPREAAHWTVRHTFDRVLLVSREGGRFSF